VLGDDCLPCPTPPFHERPPPPQRKRIQRQFQSSPASSQCAQAACRGTLLASLTIGPSARTSFRDNWNQQSQHPCICPPCPPKRCQQWALSIGKSRLTQPDMPHSTICTSSLRNLQSNGLDDLSQKHPKYRKAINLGYPQCSYMAEKVPRYSKSGVDGFSLYS
jgi:hypothetical protein